MYGHHNIVFSILQPVSKHSSSKISEIIISVIKTNMDGQNSTFWNAQIVSNQWQKYKISKIYACS